MSYQQTANAIRNMARQYEAITQAADFLDKFGTIEQAVAEAEGRQRAAEAGAAAAEKLVTDAQDKAKTIHKEAENYAALAKQAGEAEAAEAKRVAEAWAKDTVTSATAKKDELEAQARQRDADNQVLQLEIESKQAELTALNTKLEAAKAAFKAALA